MAGKDDEVDFDTLIAKMSDAVRLRALHAVIPETGQESWSEALEHLLEHIILRKQHQVDYLDRVLGSRSR